MHEHTEIVIDADMVGTFADAARKIRHDVLGQSDDTSSTDGTDEASCGASNALQAKMHKLRKVIPTSLIEELDAMGTDDLRIRISKSELNIYETERAREADEELAQLREKVKIMQGPYTDAKKAQTAIIKYCSCLLDQAGVI